jgi:hypothetical protein
LATKRGLSTAALAFGTSVASQAIMGTGIFSEHTTNATDIINTQTSAQENFAMSKSELIDGNQIQTAVKNSVQGLGSEDTVKYTFWAGTDGTVPKGVASEQAFEVFYNDKLAAAPDVVRAMHLPPQAETEALNFFKNKAWEAARGKDFMTDHLQGSRLIEDALHTLKAHAESGVQSHIEL